MRKKLNLLMAPVRRTVAVAFLAAPLTAAAQGQFSPAVRINNEIVTRFELEQRILFMDVLNIPGNPEEDARNSLIEDRLKQQLIAEAGIEPPPEEVQSGIDQMAMGANMTGEEFLTALDRAGVSAETVRDFIAIQLAWRDYIAARFLSRARPRDNEIDRAIGQGDSAGLQVLLSEIIIPVTPQTAAEADIVARQISDLDSYEAFSSAAIQYSAAETRRDGGRMDWMSIAQLPPAIRTLILDLTPGEVTAPITLPNAVALFQMRGIRESAPGTPRYASIDYAAYLMPGGRSAVALAAAAALDEKIDTCDDLFGIARNQQPEVLERTSAKPGDIPRDVALELAKLDPGEVSTVLTRNEGQTLVFLMLCGRTRELGEEIDREDVARALTEQRLNAFADSLLEQLRADAVIVDP